MTRFAIYRSELKRRVALLPSELESWTAYAQENRDGLGIHGSQIEAVNLMFAEQINLHQDLLAELTEGLEADEFARRRSELETELGGAHGLMAVFRHILQQRLGEESYKTTLDAADLVAADCYRPVIRRAMDWGVLDDDGQRPPPLTFLNARASPAAIHRSDPFSLLGFDLQSYEEMTLPASVISLRFHDTTALWSLGSLYHEVGHLLDQDLRLRSEMKGLILEALGGQADANRQALWAIWTPEILADAFGVLLGGYGFACSLEDFLLLPADEAQRVTPGDKHPAPYLRVVLLADLLRRAGVPELEEAAGEIGSAWQAFYPPPPDELVPFIGDTKRVAEALFDEPLPNRLNRRRLPELAGDLASDHRQALALARYLSDSQEDLSIETFVPGDEVSAAGFPIRLVPAGARLALDSILGDYDAACARIQERALEFVAAIPRPEYMAPGDIRPEQESYLRGLARRIRFSKPAVDIEEGQ